MHRSITFRILLWILLYASSILFSGIWTGTNRKGCKGSPMSPVGKRKKLFVEKCELNDINYL